MNPLPVKWKTFALDQVLSDYAGHPSIVYDLLTAATSDELSAVFEQYGVLVWQPFENWDEESVVAHIEAVAHAANDTANL